jgi:predicted phage tail protein
MFMTNIYLHGELAHAFGKFFKLKINNALSALKGIDANKKGFFQKISLLNKNGIYYSIIVDNQEVQNQNELIEKRNIKSIHIIPIIYGSGELAAAGLGLTVTVAGVTTLTVAGQIVAGLVNMAISLGVSFLMSALMKQAAPPSAGVQNIAVGGASATIEAAGKSYVFSNSVNTSEQGSAIPVGYGKIKTSSNVIFSSVHNYPTSSKSSEEFIRGESLILFSEFLAS